jgi:hypothetical protein
MRKNTSVVLAILLASLSIQLGATAGSADELVAVSTLVTDVTPGAINPADASVIRDFETAKGAYLSALATYKAAPVGSVAAKTAHKNVMNAWKDTKVKRTAAKKSITKTFNNSVRAAKTAFKSAVANATSSSAKAQAKSDRNAAIALASNLRNAALAAIKLPVAPPAKS